MIARIAALAATEFTIALRNRWIVIATTVLTVFSLVLTFAGSAPTGALGVTLLTVAIASMTTLAVYLVPLLALLLAFDGIAGEIERGGLALMLTYPVSRTEILIAKLLAHLATLALAVIVGFGSAGLLAWATGGADSASALGLFRLGWSAVLLGATFLAIAYALSAVARSSGAAAGLSIGLWLLFVVIYDLALLGALVADAGGVFTTEVFPWALAANPADAFRVFNLSASRDVALAAGIGGETGGIPPWGALASLLTWPLLAFGRARLAFGRVEP